MHKGGFNMHLQSAVAHTQSKRNLSLLTTAYSLFTMCNTKTYIFTVRPSYIGEYAAVYMCCDQILGVKWPHMRGTHSHNQTCSSSTNETTWLQRTKLVVHSGAVFSVLSLKINKFHVYPFRAVAFNCNIMASTLMHDPFHCVNNDT